ncbi:unnamed protein product, partial [Adineta steineri]
MHYPGKYTVEEETIFVIKKNSLTLLTLLVELVYRILDHLDIPIILLSAYGVCTRLNTIIDTYPRYKVCTKLTLRYKNIVDENLKYLANSLKMNTSFKELDFANNKIGDNGVKYLTDALQADMILEILNLYGNKISDEGVK